MRPAAAHHINPFATQGHVDRLVEGQRLPDHVQVDSENFKIGGDLFVNLGNRMFRYGDQGLYFEILKSDGIKTKEPVTSENDKLGGLKKTTSSILTITTGNLGRQAPNRKLPWHCRSGAVYLRRRGMIVPMLIAKNQRAGAGVPMGRKRRSSLAAVLGSSICLFL